MRNMGRRNDIDICHDILKVTQAGAKKTQIVYQANLNFKIVKKYIARLIEKGLLEYNEDSRLYFTTHRGGWFVEQYSDLVEPIKEDWQQAPAS